MRFVQMLAAGLSVSLSLSLAACSKPAVDTIDYEAAGMDEPGAPDSGTPEMRPVTFEPLSKTAEAFTGAISLTALAQTGANSPPAMRLEAASGLVYQTELAPGGAEQASAVDWSSIFASAIDLSSRDGGAPTIDLHIVTAETVPPNLANGGLCGAAPVFAIAMAAPLDGAAGPTIGIAAFGGDQWPPADDSTLCGTFFYAPPN